MCRRPQAQVDDAPLTWRRTDLATSRIYDPMDARVHTCVTVDVDGTLAPTYISWAYYTKYLMDQWAGGSILQACNWTKHRAGEVGFCRYISPFSSHPTGTVSRSMSTG
jgi:hypothetical protein